MAHCWRCTRGSFTRDLSGDVSCINCGAPATPPVKGAAALHIARKGTNRSRWDRGAVSAWVVI